MSGWNAVTVEGWVGWVLELGFGLAGSWDGMRGGLDQYKSVRLFKKKKSTTSSFFKNA